MQKNAENGSDGEVQTADVKFCKNCKKDIAAANFTVHEVHCVRNITLCSHCSEPIAKSDLDRHVTEQHTTVPCPHCPLQLMKSEVDRHVADVHATEPCPECGENISRTELEDHKRSVHSTIACPSCLRVVEKTSLHQHQATECAKRQQPCQFCNMVLAYSELLEHEYHCGSRTNACATCGRYIMVRDAEIHQQTACEYPAVEQKSESGSSAADEAAGFEWMGHSGSSSLFQHEMLREMLENHRHDPSVLENVFGRFGFHGAVHPRAEDLLFGDRFGSFGSDPPPPYPHESNTNNAHANAGRMTAQEESALADVVTISSDDDDDDVTLPCEFCKKLYVASKLIEHQTACQLSYVENQNERGVDDAHQLPQHAEEFQPVEQETSKPTALEVDSRSSPEPIVRDDVDSHVVTDVERSSTAGSVHVDSEVQEGTDDVSYQHPMIPCEFCLELFDEHTIAEHQDLCYRQQTSALQAILDAGNGDTSDAANRYRYPYSVMSLDDRERLGQ